MNEQTSASDKDRERWSIGLKSMQWLTFFSWFSQIRGDESLTRLKDPFSLRLTVVD